MRNLNFVNLLQHKYFFFTFIFKVKILIYFISYKYIINTIKNGEKKKPFAQ